jgi:hypothetical protein
VVLPDLGYLIPLLPVPGLKHVRDLIYFDGPLLSEFETETGETYLRHWCDVDDRANRWLLFRVSRSALTKYVFRRLGLRELIETSQDGFVYVIDKATEKGQDKIYVLHVHSIPGDYLPAPNVTFSGKASFSNGASNSYPVLIGGEWEVDDVGLFPRKYTEVYSFLHLLGDGDRPPPRNHQPFRYDFYGGAGWVARQFFRELETQIPIIEQPRIAEIRYSSPGFIRFGMNPSVATTITAAVVRFSAERAKLSERYQQLHEWVNNSGPYDDAEEKRDDEQGALSIARELTRQLGFVSWQRLLDATENDVRQLIRILLTYYRRVKSLADYQASGKADLV